MPSVSHTKRKERLALARRIENSKQLAQPCSHCRKQQRSCWLDKIESSRCSECVRSKRACDSSSYREIPRRVLRQIEGRDWKGPMPVCRFFSGPLPVRPAAVQADLSYESVDSWSPAFDLTLFVEQTLREIGESPADLNSSSWDLD